MKIDFDGGGYIEISRAPTAGNVHVVIAAKNADRTFTVNSAEISDEELTRLLSDVLVEKPKVETKTTKNKASKKPVRKKNERKSNIEDNQPTQPDQQHSEGGIQAPES